MKTHLILLCAIGLGGGLVDGATNPINPSQDKQPTATVLYVSGYQYCMEEHSYVRSDRYDWNGDHRVDTWQDSQLDFQWSDGGGGSEYGLVSYKSYDSDSPNYPDIWSCEEQCNWPVTTGPDLVSGVVTEDTCNSNDLPREAPLYLSLEHCAVNDPTNYTISQTFPGGHGVTTMDDQYNRTADTKMTLFTGGKAVAGRQNLFIIYGSATEILDKRYAPSLGGSPSRTRAIPAQNIQILGKALGSDGSLYVTLPDKQMLDATPQVKGKDFYTFSVGADKCILETPSLAPDQGVLVATNPYTYLVSYCPGSYVTVVGTPCCSTDPRALAVYWSMSGGLPYPSQNETTRLTHRLVDRSQIGSVTITATAGSLSTSIKVIVYQAKAEIYVDAGDCGFDVGHAWWNLSIEPSDVTAFLKTSDGTDVSGSLGLAGYYDHCHPIGQGQVVFGSGTFSILKSHFGLESSPHVVKVATCLNAQAKTLTKPLSASSSNPRGRPC